ncbi:MAG TPA: NfeD family protein [Thermoanaerobaculia bacterium]|nr:NfeD family protein [Thermoanaerobaculia bacterium]HQR66276.1 NfeD family protein [Thermoanaerobaculia bacterium]
MRGARFAVPVLALAALPALAGETAGKAPSAPPAPGVVVADLNTEVHAVSADFLVRTIEGAAAGGAPLVILRINTPGGRLDSTRKITQAILASPVPVVGYVWPPGGQAASAGFFVLMACDVAAMAPGTNAGAASPVGGQGEDLPKTIGKKITEDAAAHLRSLTEPRGRPGDLAAKTITEGVSFSETESREKKLVEIVARDLPDLLAQLDGRTVRRVGRPDAVLRTAGLSWNVTEMTPLQRALAVVANPALAGLLMLLGLVGLYAELQNPGAIFPGVLGGICLLLGLFALSVLPTNWVGIGLLLLGLLFFLLEVKLAGHGLFAVGGAVSMILGAVLLFYRTDFAPRGELWFLVAAAATTAAILAVLSFRAIAIQGLPDRTGEGVLVGAVVAAQTPIAPTGKVFADGAYWDARSETPVAAGQYVEIVAVDGLTLVVRPHVPPHHA